MRGANHSSKPGPATELKACLRRQAALAELGRRALLAADVDSFLQEAASRTAAVLSAEFCAVLELPPAGDGLLLRAGVGWRDGCVGGATVSAGPGSLAGYVLRRRRPVAVEDLEAETRFTIPPLLRDHGVVSGLSARIQAGERPFGVLGVYTSGRRVFDRDSICFLEAVADLLAAAAARHSADAALRDSAQRYADLLENPSDIIFTHDLSERFTSISKAIERITGYTPEEALRMTVAQIVAPEWLDVARQMRARKFAGETTTVYEIELATKSGGRAPVEVHSRLIFKDGRPVGVQGIARDISDRKKFQDALQQIAQGTAIATGDDFFWSLTKHLAQALGVRWALVAELVDGAQERVRTLAIWSDGAPGENFEYDLAGTPCENVVGQTTRHYPRRVQELFPRDRLLAEMGAESYLATPLFDATGRPLGILAVLDDQPMETASTARSVLAIFAARAGAEIERRRAEQALRESEAKYRQLFENVADIFYQTDPAGVILEISPSVERLGYRREALIGTSVLDIYADQAERIALVKAVMEQGEVNDFGVRFKTGDGGVIDASVSARLVRGPDGAIRFFEGSVRDISDRKRAEEALRESEAKYRRFFDNVRDIFYVTDASGIITDITPSVERYGYTPAGLIGTQVLDVYPNPADRAALVERILQDGEVIDYDLRLKTGDGRVVPASVTARALLGPNGEFLGVEGALRDISERKRAEEALRQSEERLRGILESTADGILVVDGGGQAIYANARFAEMWHIPPAVLETRSDEKLLASVLDQLAEPEAFLAKVRALYQTAEDSLDTVTFKDGRVFERYSRPLLGPEGVAGRVWSFRDITERKRAEEALRETNQTLQTLIDASPLAIVALDPDARVRLWNRAAERIFGWSAQEVLGALPPYIPEDRQQESRAFQRQVLREGQMFSDLETRRRRKDGSLIDVSISAAPLHDASGAIAGGVSLIADITERKRAEEAFRQSEQRLRTLVANVPVVLFAVDRDGVFTLSEGKGLEALGLRPGEVVGRSVADVYRDSPRIIANIRRALTGKEFAATVEVDGLAFETHYAPMRGPDGSVTGVIGVAIDTTARLAMERELLETNRTLQTLIDASPLAIIVTDPDATVRLWNPAAERIFGWTAEEVLGRPNPIIPDVPAREQRKIRAHQRRIVLAGKTYQGIELRRQRKDGTVIDVSLSAAPLRDSAGRVSGVMGILADITERKRAEEALREQARRDPLTGTLNHASITAELQDLISRHEDGASLAVAMVDVDGLKAVNDIYGHQMGDAVLSAVAAALQRDGAIVGRYGGDEFLALLPGADRPAAERYRDAVLQALAAQGIADPESGSSINLVASIGLAVYPEEADTVGDLVRLSDSAMYEARRQRPVRAADLATLRQMADERAARIVGGIVPLLTSPGNLEDKLRLVSYQLSAGAGYDAVNFVLFSDPASPPIAANTVARVQDELLEAWNADQRRDADPHPLRLILERTRRPVTLDDLEHDPRITETQRALLAAGGFRSALVTPMLWQNRLVGIMSVASKQEKAFGARDAQFLTAVATQVTAIVRMGLLVEELQTASASLAEAHADTVMLLAAAAEAHDHTTGLHLQNIRALTEALARELGYREQDAVQLGLAAVLHDIGKIRVPDAVLAGSGPLTDEDWEIMKRHTIWGAEFLDGRPGFDLAATVAHFHHERWDGSGYPEALAGDAIPRPAAIVAVADAFDAMTSDRPYREALSAAQAVKEIEICAGRQFSPEVVSALVRLHQRHALPHPAAAEDQREAA